MNKFNFYTLYWDSFDELRPSQLKKLLKAMSNYSESGEIPYKLPKKALMLFNELRVVLDSEKKIEEITNKRKRAGKKGMKKRWQ